MHPLIHRLRRVGMALALCALSSPATWAAGFTFTPYPNAHTLPLSQVTFENGQGKPMTLADFKGKVVLLNIWATWCPPCVHEMPTLDKLQKLLGGKNFAVVPLSVDKGGIYTVKSFYDDNFISHLPIYVDPTTNVLDTLSILGTPTTILINKQGKEIARTMGPEDWDQPAVIAQIKHYMAAPARSTAKPQQQARTVDTHDTRMAAATTPATPE
ncbi:MAG: TlpA family protein disulfide reductase [Burkholderiaceae bacterium]|nr:TlpA family protein disulfide reductase [Burkholderiaceae bacterium]